jgi:hypothetical protein
LFNRDWRRVSFVSDNVTNRLGFQAMNRLANLLNKLLSS